MKILWVADCDLKTRPAGGAELTDYFMMEAGKQRGHSINYVTRNDFRRTNLDEYDFIVLSNNYSYSDRDRKEVLKRKFILYNHDFQAWKRVIKNRPELLYKSKLNIFLSPLHKKSFEKLLGTTIPKVICIPPHIPTYIKDEGLKRKKNVIIYAGNLWGGLKGANLLHSYAIDNSDKQFYFYFQRYNKYWLDKLKRVSNVNLKGYAKHKDLYRILNKAEYFIHLPDDIEAFGRAVAEAYLCGCKIIGNGNIGAFSYKWSKFKPYFRNKTKNSPKVFWNNIEENVKIDNI